ncbi:hypothetical protein CCMA1212_007181 [Trichoderma ghanense]|uniref:RRM domain-containing protein n=1 Tax=Trichoderma ghanense TaxID=65468 RepID=A0ABY2H0H6_9HYPO
MADSIRMNLQPAPHPVVYAADFPKVHGENFPHGVRAAFSKYYPYGIPVTYKMMHGVHSQGVAQTYLEDHLPVGFYTTVPPKARAFISTSNGTRPFRKLDHILPQRRIHLWSKDEIQTICNSLRKLYWNELKDMQQPHCWDDLWTYFDAHDLYHNGCMNLWNVINTIWDENKIIAVDVSREIAAHIGHWADDWLKREENKEKLIRWVESHGPIFRILDDQDHESLGLIQDDVLPLIASALKSRRTFLLSSRQAGQVEEPAELVTACGTNSIENWLTTYTQQQLDNPKAESIQEVTTISPPRLEHWQTQGSDGPMHDNAAMKPFHSSQRHRRSTQDARYYADNFPNGYIRPNAGLPFKSSTEPTPFYMQPEKDFTPTHLASTTGFPHQREHLYSAANKQLPHSAPYREFSGASQFAPHQQFANVTHSGVVPSVKLRNPPVSSTDENIRPLQATQPEPYHGSSTASSQTGYNANSRMHHKAGQRRGSQGQKTHGYNPGQQAQAEHHVTPHETYPNKSWRRGAQQDDARQSSWCRNPVGSNYMDYVHCTCSGCAERNRSVYVSVTHDARLQRMEIQAFLKFGLSGKFGQVEEVCPAASLHRDAFIVRFVTESSVSLALAFGGGLIPEKNIRLLIRPVHRSKWMKNLPYPQARPLPPVPTAHQQPGWVGKAPSSTTLGHGQTAAPGPSLAPSPTHSPGRGQPATSSSPKSAEALPQTTVSGESVIQEASVQDIEATSVSPHNDQPNQASDSTVTHDQATSRKNESPSRPKHKNQPKPDQASPRTKSPVQIKKKDKKDVAAQSNSPSDDTVGQEATACISTIPPSEDDGCSSPRKTPVTQSPLKPSPTTAEQIPTSEPFVAPHPDVGNSSPISKSQERRVPEKPTPEKTDGPHLNAHINNTDAQGNTRSGKRSESVKSSLTEAHAAAPNAVVDLPATVPKSSQNRPEPANMGNHMRASSIFTEEEIRQRKQAWNRIPMPLDPRKSKRPGSKAGSSQPTTPRAPAPEEMENKGDFTSSTGEKAHIDLMESSTASHQESRLSWEGPEGSDEEKVRGPVNDECSRSEQRPISSKDFAPESQNAEGTNGEDAFDPPLQSPASSSWASELVEDAGIGPGMGPLCAANAAANQQSKAKAKWNKNKKSKKRLTPAPLNVLQKGNDSQGRPPSDLDTNTTPLEGKPEVEHDNVTPTIAASEILARPASVTERLGESSFEPPKDPREQGTASLRGHYHYDTLPRGRLDFRQNAGGSLKVSKKRKNKYPSINSRTFEPSTSGRSLLSPSGHATGGQMPTTAESEGASTIKSTIKAEASNSSSKSRLNPLATSFESPRKGGAAELGTQASSVSSGATSSRAGPREGSHDKPQSPSKVNIMQRPAAAHSSPTKAPQLRERLNRGFTGVDDHSEVSNKQQENNPPGRRREGSNDRPRDERGNKKPVKSSSASPKREDGKTQANFEAADWPALPASRARSATLQ